MASHLGGEWGAFGGLVSGRLDCKCNGVICKAGVECA